MHWISGIDSARMREIHLDRIGSLDLTLTALQILVDQMKIFDLQSPDRNRHPAILVAMIMNRTRLPYFPADCHQFV